MAEGKLVVLEGIDGSGKSANYRRLCAHMDDSGISYHSVVFPRYDKESSALIRMYLNGEFGPHPNDVNAYTASIFYAVDRFASYRSDWGKIYENGGLILSDRYTTSNAVHQGASSDSDRYGNQREQCMLATHLPDPGLRTPRSNRPIRLSAMLPLLRSFAPRPPATFEQQRSKITSQATSVQQEQSSERDNPFSTK